MDHTIAHPNYLPTVLPDFAMIAADDAELAAHAATLEPLQWHDQEYLDLLHVAEHQVVEALDRAYEAQDVYYDVPSLREKCRAIVEFLKIELRTIRYFIANF